MKALLNLTTGAALLLGSAPAMAQLTPVEPPPKAAEIDCTTNPASLQCRLERLEQQEASKWRHFATYNGGRVEACAYRWAGWKLDPKSGIRTSLRRCNSILNPKLPGINAGETIKVDCASLKVSSGMAVIANFWQFPEGPDREMVISLCSNAKQG